MEIGSIASSFDVEKLSGRERSLANLIPIKVGEVRNPRGAGASGSNLVLYIREQSLQGRSIVDFLLEVLSGKNGKFEKTSDRLEAARILLDRGWGQPKQVIDLQQSEGKPLLDLTKLTAAEFEQFKALAVKIAPVGDQTQETASQEPRTDTISPKDVPKVQPNENLGSSETKP